MEGFSNQIVSLNQELERPRSQDVFCPFKESLGILFSQLNGDF